MFKNIIDFLNEFLQRRGSTIELGRVRKISGFLLNRWGGCDLYDLSSGLFYGGGSGGGGVRGIIPPMPLP